MTLNERIQHCEAELDDLRQRALEDNEYWEPKQNEVAFYIDHKGTIVQYLDWEMPEGKDIINLGNYYRTCCYFFVCLNS